MAKECHDMRELRDKATAGARSGQMILSVTTERNGASVAALDQIKKPQ
jgi:hypothetical protein